jgi:hypothetical protein
MILETLLEEFDAFKAKQREILIKKNSDYSDSTDALSNFKKVGDLRFTGAEDPVIVAINTKIVRLNNLLSSGKIPNNESIADTLVDLSNYTFFLHVILNEKEL